MRVEADVIIAGAGPVGLMLAGELRLAGVRPLVLERYAERSEVPRANGLGGHILEMLRYRGVLEEFEAASIGMAHPAPKYPFGDVHLDFSNLADPPLRGLYLPQQRLERLLEERAAELGAEVRRGHEITGFTQDDTAVTVQATGPDGAYEVTGRYLVGCDGGRSRVRELAGIAFPGTTYPEVNRLGQVTLPDSVTTSDNGDLEVPGLGLVRAGFTRTERGLFGFGWLSPGLALIQTTEKEPAEIGEGGLTLAELGDSIERVLGGRLPLGEPVRLSRYQFQARQAERYRDGRVLIAGDAAHLFPATGVGLNAGLYDAVNLAWKLTGELDGWAPPGLLDTYHAERHYAGARTMMHTQAQVALRRGLDPAADALRELFLEIVTDEQPLRRIGSLLAGADLRYPMPGADHPLAGGFAPDLTLHTDQGTTGVAELMHPARPVLLDLADRADLREVAQDWKEIVEIRTAKAEDRPADALLIRPDAHVAWAAATGEPGETAAPALRTALTTWFG
ncbi:FAD-dependent monooxygenase [Amycolatopsis magusensis]|uniref:FAD-dependent monooxygenase n=1 Tax=Amycolatopsis magusensis TaxID=882444 RepID=UPI00378FCCCC